MPVDTPRERIRKRLFGSVLAAWTHTSRAYSVLSAVGRIVGEKLIWIIGFVLGGPIIPPLLVIRRIVPNAEPILTPIIWFFRYLFFWYPLAIWHRVCGVTDWALKWTTLSLIISVMFVWNVIHLLVYYLRRVGHFALNPRYSALKWTVQRGLEVGRALSFYLVAIVVIGLGLLSQIAYWIGRAFILVDVAIDWVVKRVLSESDLENLEEEVQYYAEHAYGGEMFETYEGISHRQLIEGSLEEQRVSLDFMAHGEFLLSILITAMALALTFLPGLRTVTLYEATHMSMEIRLSMLLSLQLFLAASTIVLLVSVIIRTKVVEYLTVDSLSIFDDSEKIIPAARTNAELGSSFSSVLMGVLYTENWYGTTEEFDYEMVQETLDLPLRDKFLYYLREGVEDSLKSEDG